MNANSTLVSVGQFDLKLNHLLIIAILSLSFSLSFLIRSQPADYGWELHEFDPFFNYRATEYIVENGFDSYFQWNDDLSWYPHGRDVSQTSQVMLHLTAAITYWIFGGGSNLYDYTILFPVIIGSLTAIVLFALVRTIGGTTAGLFAAMFFSISIPIIIRGQIGWFKSEPLGLFFSVLAVYLLLSGINAKNSRIAVAKIIPAGVFLIFAMSSWGGNQFFIIPIGVFFLTLPFLRTDHRFLLCTIPIFTASTFVTSLAFERLSSNFIIGLGGLSLLVPTIFLVICILIQKKSSKNKNRNGLIFLAAILIIGSSVLILNSNSDYFLLPTHRYLNAINPFLITTDPLTDSVSEHATTTISQSFLFHSVLMIFAGIGIWLLLKNSKSTYVKNDMISFSLILGLVGVYVSSAFVRLEVFASLGIIILSSLGLSILFKEIFSNKIELKKSIVFKLPISIGIFLFLLMPVFLPANGTVFAVTDIPPTIMNGGSKFQVSTSDWLDTLEWIKNNTPQDAVIGSWWDYGYWIQTKADRASLADNSTTNAQIIEKIAALLFLSPDKGWEVLREMEADYFLVFVAGQRLNVDNGDQALYILDGGGDESKKAWFMRIAHEPLAKHLHPDGQSGTDYFWNETLLGQMFPFSPIIYANLQTEEQSLNYRPGFTPIYVKDNKFPNTENGPLKLVYTSPSYDVEKGGHVLGVFVYEINKDYVPTN